MISIPRSRWAVPFLALGVLAVAGCDDDDDDPVGPTGGTLEVTVTATGAPADPDGFTVLLDGTQIGAVVPATGGTVTEDALDAGDYEVELSSLAANCTVAGDNPATATIVDDEVTEVTFAVTCTAAPAGGTVSVTTTTTGDNPDPDGYELTVAGGAPQTIGANATLDVTGVAAGDAEVALADIQANCAVTGDNPLTVAVVDATTVPAAFEITCATSTGNAEVTITTTGTNLDADGYELTVDAGTPIAADINGTFIVPSLSAGDHDFSLGGVAANCTVTGGTDQTVTVTDQQTAAVAYDVTCT